MKVGDVLLFVGGKRIIDDLISWETDSEFTHAALAISETEYIEAWWQGVRKNNIKNYKDVFKNIIVFTPITPLIEFQKDQIIRYAAEKIGEPFNFLQILGVMIEKTSHLKYNPFGSKRKTICSQLVFQAYKQLFNVDLLPDIEDYSVAPCDLATSKLLREENDIVRE